MTPYDAHSIWWLMLLSGLATFLIRYSFIAAEGHYRAPDWFRAGMPFVPIAMLTALVVPDVLLVAGHWNISLDNPKAIAALVAILAAARWRNILITIASGFATLYLVRWLV